VGEGVQQRGGPGRPEGVHAGERPETLPAEALGSGANLLLVQNRRMSKDYERLPQSSEAFIYAAMSRLMARRLARP
jgi:transposase